jgi:hypothetical protein
MVLERFETHCAEKDTSVIVSIVKEKLVNFNYKIKKPKDEYLDYYTLNVTKDFYHWLIKFHMNLGRTGNLVDVEISRTEPFSISRYLAERRERKQKNRVQTSFFHLFIRFWWLYILGSFVGSIVLSFWPGTTDPISITGYVLMGILGSVLLVYFVNILFIRYQRKHVGERAEMLKMQLMSIIESVDGLSTKSSILCWSCYKEVIPEKRKCPNCNVELVKLE